MSNEFLDSLKRLPHVYNKSVDGAGEPVSLIGKLIKLVTMQIDNIKTVCSQIRNSHDIDQAIGKTLDYIGSNVQQGRGKATDQVFRAIIKTKIARNINQGDINSLISILSVTLNCPVEDIELIEKYTQEPSIPASITVHVPEHVLNDMGLTPNQYHFLLKKIVAAGIGVDTLYAGSFGFSSDLNVPEFDSVEGFDEGTLGAYIGLDNEYEMPD